MESKVCQQPSSRIRHHGNRWGRSEEAREAVMEAVDNLLLERGFAALTIEAGGCARRRRQADDLSLVGFEDRPAARRLHRRNAGGTAADRDRIARHRLPGTAVAVRRLFQRCQQRRDVSRPRRPGAARGAGRQAVPRRSAGRPSWPASTGPSMRAGRATPGRRRPTGQRRSRRSSRHCSTACWSRASRSAISPSDRIVDQVLAGGFAGVDQGQGVSRGAPPA